MADGGRRRRDERRPSAPGLHRALLVALVLALAATTAACTGGGAVGGDDAAADTVAPGGATSTTSITATTAPGPPTTLAADDPEGARLRVTQDVTACCYPSGHVSWLLVRDRSGGEVLQRRVRPLADPFPLVDQLLPARAYHLVSAQQRCSGGGTCTLVGDAVDRCDVDIDLAPGSTTYLTVGVSPGGGCAIVLAPGPLPAPIADEVALPQAALDCGFDSSLADAAATGRNVVLSDARRCFAAAVERGDPAWMLADEPADVAGAITSVVYRVGADGVVTVYQVVDPAAPVWTWVRSTCADTAPDEVRGFLVQGCAVPEAVPWAATA